MTNTELQTHFDDHFTADCWPMSLDEVLGGRDLIVAIELLEHDPSVGLNGGFEVSVFARDLGADESEDITHLLSAAELRALERDAALYLQAQEEAQV